MYPSLMEMKAMREDSNKASPGPQKRRDTYATMSVLAWIAVGILFLNVAYFVGNEVGGGQVLDRDARFWPVVNSFLIGLLKAGPTILIGLALLEFAFFFDRCSKDETFTEANLKTLRSGADSLVWAAITSAIVIPSVLGAIGDAAGRDVFDFTELALGVGLMGLALHGLAIVFDDAVKLKEDNDQFV